MKVTSHGINSGSSTTQEDTRWLSSDGCFKSFIRTWVLGWCDNSVLNNTNWELYKYQWQQSQNWTACWLMITVVLSCFLGLLWWICNKASLFTTSLNWTAVCVSMCVHIWLPFLCLLATLYMAVTSYLHLHAHPLSTTGLCFRPGGVSALATIMEVASFTCCKGPWWISNLFSILGPLPGRSVHIVSVLAELPKATQGLLVIDMSNIKLVTMRGL